MTYKQQKMKHCTVITKKQNNSASIIQMAMIMAYKQQKK